MYYGIETLELERINFLTGETGSGKSSLIDAIQIIFTGEISKFFNRSATGTKSERTLVTYLRGKSDDGNFKRSGKPFSSYIAADFYDEQHRENFCYGIAFDLDEDDDCKHEFFYLTTHFQKQWALRDDGNVVSALMRKDFKKTLKEQNIPINIFNRSEYRKHLLTKLGIYDDNFFQVFKDAVAYVPLDKIEDFIVKNICHMDDGIDVEKMREAIQNYRKIQQDMSDFLERKEELETLKDIYDSFETQRNTYYVQEYIVKRANVENFREKQTAAENEVTRLEEEIAQANRQIDGYTALIKENRARDTELTKLLLEDPNAKRAEELKIAIDSCNMSISDIENKRDEQLQRMNQRALAWNRVLNDILASETTENFINSGLDIIGESLRSFGDCTTDGFNMLDISRLREINKKLEELKKDAITLQEQWKIQYNKSTEAINGYNKSLEDLKKGIKSYPPELLALRDYLKSKLHGEDGNNVDVSILADVITITDAKWVNVIEGYIRRQKLYLLVDPKHYRQAVRFFENYSKQNKCYQYRIVNTESLLQEDFNILDNSLADVISTNHQAAGKYIEYLLGHVERVDDISTVMGRRTAVTSDGMLYHGFTVARMNEADWQMKYIGQDSIARQIEEIERLLEEETKQSETLKTSIETLSPVVDEKTLSDEFLENIAFAVEKAQELPGLEKQLNDLWEENQRLDLSYKNKLEKEQNEINEKISSLENEKRKKDKESNLLEFQKEQQFKYGDEMEQQWETAKAIFLQEYPDGSSITEDAAPRYDSVRRGKDSAEKVYQDYKPALENTKSKMEKLTESFREKAEIYNKQHTESTISTQLASSEWRKAYDDVSNVHLEEYKEHVETAKKQAEEIFQNDFINHIKGNIDTVKREIAALNKALEGFTFGNTKYRFKWAPTENAQMREYYDMIISARLDGVSIFDLLEPGMDADEYEPLIKTLFELISSEGSDRVHRKIIEDNIAKYTSIKTYLNFDLMEVDSDGREHSLRSSINSKSGGERQTPFYIAILASLMKTYRISQNANSLRLVVFDEAFDKIDTNRLEECIDMLREIGFQSIIAAPDSKAPYIVPVVDRTIAVIKPNYQTSILRSYHKTLEEKV